MIRALDQPADAVANAVSNLMLVDGHTCFRQALACLLDSEPGFETVAQAGTLAGARRLLTGDVDLAVVSLHLPDGSGTDLVKQVRALNPQGRVLILTGDLDEVDSSRAAEAGASEILPKSVAVARIVETVRRLGRNSNRLQAYSGT